MLHYKAGLRIEAPFARLQMTPSEGFSRNRWVCEKERRSPMLIGLDFDNTIVRYDRLFHRLARKRGLIPDGIPVSKQAVRDHLRANGREADWTELQGMAYG